ncbi:MAG: AAA family ATPase [Lachnospiraceae bacterium]|nr:AAA family ATPase [Lachnospiraceae bacterium]
MDKRVIFAVAGAGKTTYIVDNLTSTKRSLIVTYTIANCENLRKKITEKFDGVWPSNVTLLSYFSFLHGFCYKPFLSDMYKTCGIIYKPNPNRFERQNDLSYYMTDNRYLYSNRLSLFMEKQGILEDIKNRICKYFDEFIIDEIQDISGRDFSFLENLMENSIDMLFVGDFYQHTYDTSQDGNVNGKLFESKKIYEARFANKGFIVDNTTLKKSWRCSQNICQYIRDNLDIDISSNRGETDNTTIEFIDNKQQINFILMDDKIIKLHYQNGAKVGAYHKNWGETKGEDCYQDVCVMLNKKTAKERTAGRLAELPPSTKNKLYVAITRAKGNVYIINE